MPEPVTIRLKVQRIPPTLLLDSGVFYSNSVREAQPILKPLKNKVFQESRVTTIALYDIGTSTTLESNKSDT